METKSTNEKTMNIALPARVVLVGRTHSGITNGSLLKIIKLIKAQMGQGNSK
jgi:hypothetical protein